jgi:hypothetical protein
MENPVMFDVEIRRLDIWYVIFQDHMLILNLVL